MRFIAKLLLCAAGILAIYGLPEMLADAVTR